MSCRVSKTRCLKDAGDEKCKRCTRIGAKCVACGPSRRGLCHPNRVKKEAAARRAVAGSAVARVEAAEQNEELEACWGIDELAAGLDSDELMAALDDPALLDEEAECLSYRSDEM